jgi:hypothetical protein
MSFLASWFLKEAPGSPLTYGAVIDDPLLGQIHRRPLPKQTPESKFGQDQT